jgi:hypothetical protein
VSHFLPGSRSRLTRRDLGRFPGTTLFDTLARAVCQAECLPRRELYESWEVARRVRRRFRGGRVVDHACGHGLVAHLMLLLDDTSPSAIAVDPRPTPSAVPLAAALATAWPQLAGRVKIEARAIADVELYASDVVVATHACGHLTDEVIDSAVASRTRLALLPCCQDGETCDAGGLKGWMDVGLAIDVTRVARLRAEGYAVTTQTIPRAITAKNRLLLASPAENG